MTDRATPGELIDLILPGEEGVDQRILTYEVLLDFDLEAEKLASQNKNGIFEDQEFQVEGFMIELQRRGLVKLVSGH